MSELENSILLTDLESYMDEKFVDNALKLSGVNVVRVRFIDPNKRGSKQCYALLKNVNACHEAVRILNDKIIPRSAPPQQFKVKYGYYGKAEYRHDSFSERRPNKPAGQINRPCDDPSLFVSSLSDDVTSDDLYSGFAAKYRIVSAKVLNYGDGRSKGCGFVRFATEYEAQKALIEMQHMTGIGKNPLRVRIAYKNPPNKESTGGSYSPSMNPYYPYQNYQNFCVPPSSSQTLNTTAQDYESYYQYAYPYPSSTDVTPYSCASYEDDTLEEPVVEDDVEKVNEEFMEKNEEFYIALEESRWPNVEDIMDSPITA